MRAFGTVLFIATFCAWCGVAAGQASRPADAEPGASAEAPGVDETAGNPWATIAPDYAPEKDQVLQRRKGPSKTAVLAEGAEESNGRFSFRTFGALAGVVGLIVFLGWGYRAMAGGTLALLGKNRRSGVIEVISKTALSAKQSLCLVRVGPRMVLIGQSPDALRTLDVIEDPAVVAELAGGAARKSPTGGDAEFQNCLENETRQYPREAAGEINETVTPEVRRIDDVRQSLTDTIRRIRGSVGQS